MKCCVCGAESGHYPLCRACNQKKEQGLIIKCTQCGQWHYADAPCPQPNAPEFLYECRKSLITANEQQFFKALKEIVPQGYHVFPQINLAAFIERVDNTPFRNELFRNVDFLITDAAFAPKIAVEINDPTHHEYERRKRDEKVAAICAEAGVPIVTLWTNYGVNREYMQKRITETLENPPQRLAHHGEKPAEPQPCTVIEPQPRTVTELQQTWDEHAAAHNETRKKKQGCYVATCVYGSYDCPQVWTLRRYRDDVLKNTTAGRCFISLYYAVSPTMVRIFGRNQAVRRMWRTALDRIISRLNADGFSDKPYNDQ